MASALTAKVVGFEKLATKLDVTLLDKDRKTLIKDAGDQTKASYGPTLPRATGASAAKLSLTVTSTAATVSVPRYPFVFLEKGSQYPGEGKRSHRGKTAAQWKAGTYRIKPRHFQSKERARVRKRLVVLLGAMKARIEARWAA